MNLNEITENIQKKLGKEESSKIADDLANIMVFDKANNDILKDKDAKIEKLGKDKEMLIEANGNLLLQVPQSNKDSFNDNQNKKEEPRKRFDFRTIFDEKGNIKR